MSRRLLCYDALIIGYPCRKGLAWKVGKLGREVEHWEDPRLLEISEREHHCQILLTPENIYVARHNPAPYTLSVIPRPLPSYVMEGEHFMVADLQSLVSGSASSSRNPVIKASSRVQGARGTSRSSSSSSGDSSSSPPTRPERLLLPAQVAGPTPRVVKVKRKKASGRRNALGSKGEDFIPWIPVDTEGPQDLEEEEQEERMAGVLDRYAARKRKRRVISSCESNTALVQVGGPSLLAADGQLAADGSSGDQAIIILCSPELGPTGQTEPDGADRSGSNEDGSTPTALQVIPPSDQAEEQPSR